MAENSTLVMKSFLFSYGGFFEGHNEIQIEEKDNWSVLDNTLSSIYTRGCNYIKLSSEEWTSFSNTIMKKYHIYDWNDKYVNHNIYDGTQWSIKIVFVDGQEKNIIGSNCFPENFWDFKGFIDSFNPEKLKR